MLRQRGFHHVNTEWMIVVCIFAILAAIVIPQYRNRQDKVALVHIKSALKPLRTAIEAQLMADVKPIKVDDVLLQLKEESAISGKPQVSPQGEIHVAVVWRDEAGTLTLTPKPEAATSGGTAHVYWRCQSTVFAQC